MTDLDAWTEEIDRLNAENEQMRGALEEIAATCCDMRVNEICRRGLGRADNPQTVKLLAEIRRQTPQPWMRRP